MPTPLVGKDCSVKLATNSIVLMGTWSLSGVNTDQLETTAFGNEWKTYEFGLKDGGTVSFSGLYDATDTTGQHELMEANVEATDLTDIRLYINTTSYFVPNQTDGYFSPTVTTGASTEESHVNITSLNINSDKSGLVNIDFTGKVSGVMVLV